MRSLTSVNYSRILLGLFFITATIISLKLYHSPNVKIDQILFEVKPYNNFLIFKWAGFNILNELPLYISNDPVHYDLYKYSPTCALFFSVFAFLPDSIGLWIWTSLNLILPFLALQQIIGLNTKHRNGMALLILAESFTASLNTQSNGLVLGLLMLAIASFQREKISKTILWILLAGLIKVFGWIFFCMFLIKPNKIPQGIIWGVIWTILLVSMPLLWVDWDYLISEYRWWLLLLQNDGSQYVKLSFMGWFLAWFGVIPMKNLVLILALCIQIIPLLFYQRATPSESNFIHKIGASLLIWVVLFNHMAESATYIIAIGGMAIYFSGEIDRGYKYYGLLSMIILFTILGPTDLYPKEWRIWIVEKAQLKAFPIIILWMVLMYDLFKTVFIKKAPEFGSLLNNSK